MNRLQTLSLVVAVIVPAFAAPAHGARIFVDTNAAGVIQTGASWARAFHGLQSAIAAANPGDEIWVADGVYKPATPATPDPRTETFRLDKNISLYGGFLGGETSLAQRVPLSNKAVLSGDINGNDTPNFGNRADNSLHVVTTIGPESIVTIDGFVIEGGQADVIPQTAGGGIFALADRTQVVNCWFRSNMAIGPGGGVFQSTGTCFLTGCIFSGNQALEGSAVRVQNGSINMNCCTVVGNTTGFGQSRSAVAALNGAGFGIIGCILWGNSNGAGQAQDAQVGVSNTPLGIVFCNIQGGLAGLGALSSISSDPGFIDADGADNVFGTDDDDVRIFAMSCIDKLPTSSLQGDLSDMDGDGITLEKIPYTIAGQTRTHDDTGAPNFPNASNITDLGVHEFQGVSCLGDLNGDRLVNTADLTRFLGAFGTSGDAQKPGDLNRDGLVNTADLTTFLGRFGQPCPN